MEENLPFAKADRGREHAFVNLGTNIRLLFISLGFEDLKIKMLNMQDLRTVSFFLLDMQSQNLSMPVDQCAC